MRSWLAVGVSIMAGCGRIAFDTASDAHERRDILPIDVVPLDSSLPAGLVSWYPMDDSPNNTADVVGGVNGTCGTVQTCPTQMPGHHGGAFMFDAAKDCIEIPDLGQLALQRYTLAIWAMQTAADSCSAFAKRVDVGASVLDSWQVYTSTAGQVELAMNDGSTALSKISTPDSTLGIGMVWHHIAATVDGTTRILYYDGTQVASSPWTTTNYDTHSVWVGCDDQGGDLWSLHWQGALDDFQIYNRALSATEVMMLASQ